MEKTTLRDVQDKILEIMKYIDTICRENDIQYFIMGGTALGAIRHKGFIPWDDDLDIFMTYDEYRKFKNIFESINNKDFIIQEWKTTPRYLEYAKVRMNGTTFIEHAYKDRKEIHQGIYVDIMILHKVPMKRWIQKIVYYESKLVTAIGLSQRNWIPKNNVQKILISIIKMLPSELLATICYSHIYNYDGIQSGFKWSYWITKSKFNQGLFDKKFFDNAVDIQFEDTQFKCSPYVTEYLTLRYGDYMKLPSVEEQKNVVHAEIYDVYKDYKEYLGEI